MKIDIPLHLYDYYVIIAYVASVLILGFWVSFRREHTDDLFLAGRKLTWPNIGLSIWGTNINPSVLLVFCSMGYSLGMVGGNYSWLAWPFLVLLAMVFVPHYLNTQVCTMPEFMSRRFGPSCRVFLSWYVLFTTLVIWLGFTLYAGGLLMVQIFNWPFWICAVVLAVIATSFTVAGGLAAVVITDSFQSILIIVSSIVLTAIAFSKVGGLDNLLDKVPADHWRLFRADKAVGDYAWYSVLLGYPVAGIWFWCTDQTIVQRVLGAKDIRQGQLGAVFAGFLKILDVLVFLLPGIMCRALHPNLTDTDTAYVTMVTSYMPAGMVGLIVAVLIAALISTIDSGLNSLSTVFTLDIYKHDQAQPDNKRVIMIGRIVTVAAAVVMVLMALLLKFIKDRRGLDLFTMGQSLIGFFAPPMAAVFIVGILWRRANEIAAFATLVFGTALCLIVGAVWMSGGFDAESGILYYLNMFPFLSFVLFAVLMVFMVIVALITPVPDPAKTLPTLQETYAKHGQTPIGVWKLWVLLAVIMAILYTVFN